MVCATSEYQQRVVVGELQPDGIRQHHAGIARPGSAPLLTVDAQFRARERLRGPHRGDATVLGGLERRRRVGDEENAHQAATAIFSLQAPYAQSRASRRQAVRDRDHARRRRSGSGGASGFCVASGGERSWSEGERFEMLIPARWGSRRRRAPH